MTTMTEWDDVNANKEASIKILETLLERVRSGELVLSGINQNIRHTKVYDNETQKWVYFSIGGGTMGWSFTCPTQEQEEKDRLEKFLAEHPRAEIVEETTK